MIAESDLEEIQPKTPSGVPSQSQVQSWRMDDLRKALADRGFPACDEVIREAIRKAGFRWRSAKIVLTSNDPSYREKLERVHKVLSNLRDDERFFSIDEYGPFAIKAKPGRVLAGRGESPSVPQWQKSKGWLIATAALERKRLPTPPCAPV